MQEYNKKRVDNHQKNRKKLLKVYVAYDNFQSSILSVWKSTQVLENHIIYFKKEEVFGNSNSFGAPIACWNLEKAIHNEKC